MPILLTVALFLASCQKHAQPVFSVVDVPVAAGTGSAEPHLARGPNGSVVLSWLQPEGDDTRLLFSVWHDNAWQVPQEVARDANWFVNWADFASVVPISDAFWAAHWLVKRPGGTYAYDIAVALSQDAGATWSEPFTPHDDGTRTEHGFVTLFSRGDSAGMLWLDGRNTAADMPGHGDGHAGHSGGMTLRSAVVAPDGGIRAALEVDGLVCDCCQTDVANSAAGPVAVYRDRSEDEIRDIFVARGDGENWHAPQPVANDGWRIDGCPVNGPAIAALDDIVVTAWFTAATNESRVRAARSEDNGETFSVPVEIDADGVVGRVDVEILANGNAVVSWLRDAADQDHGELCARIITPDGQTGPVRVIARMDTARVSGFPQMIRDGNQLLFAWTEVSNGSTRVRSARLPDAI